MVAGIAASKRVLAEGTVVAGIDYRPSEVKRRSPGPRLNVNTPRRVFIQSY